MRFHKVARARCAHLDHWANFGHERKLTDCNCFSMAGREGTGLNVNHCNHFPGSCNGHSLFDSVIAQWYCAGEGARLSTGLADSKLSFLCDYLGPVGST